MKKIRMTVDLSVRQNERLEDLTERCGAVSKADTIRQALRLYEYLVDVHSKGYQVTLTKDGESAGVPIFADAATAPAVA